MAHVAGPGWSQVLMQTRFLVSADSPVDGVNDSVENIWKVPPTVTYL